MNKDSKMLAEAYEDVKKTSTQKKLEMFKKHFEKLQNKFPEIMVHTNIHGDLYAYLEKEKIQLPAYGGVQKY